MNKPKVVTITLNPSMEKTAFRLHEVLTSVKKVKTRLKILESGTGELKDDLDIEAYQPIADRDSAILVTGEGTPILSLSKARETIFLPSAKVAEFLRLTLQSGVSPDLVDEVVMAMKEADILDAISFTKGSLPPAAKALFETMSEAKVGARSMKPL